MFRFVLPLLLMLVLAAVSVLNGGQNNSAHSFMPPGQASLTNLAKSGHIDGMSHDSEASSGVKRGCDAAKPCSTCKLCHVCPHAALAGDGGSASLWASLSVQPTHFEAAWLSAEHALDFKPPIL